MELPFFEKKLSDHTELFWGYLPKDADKLRNIVKLSSEEQVYFGKIKNEKRKTEWLYSRYLLQQKSPDFRTSYSTNGKPLLNKPELSVSISHTGDFVAVLLSKAPKAGLDVQLPKQQLFRVSHKFVHDQEKQWIDTENLSHLCLLWSAKEALYKLHGVGGLDFKENMRISESIDKQDNAFEIRIATTALEQSYLVRHFTIDGIIIAWIEA